MKIHIHLIRVIITLIISVASPLFLTVTTPDISSVFAESVSTEDKKAEADRLLNLGMQQYKQRQLQEVQNPQFASPTGQGNYSFKFGSQQFNFTGLPFAGIEVENLVQTIANTTKLINQTFSAKTTIFKMREHSLVHLATHAAFVVGKPEDSFILFGNGVTPFGRLAPLIALPYGR